jgi:pre-mRNA-splicing factor ISY1
MARNQEKAQSMLNRYLQGRQDEERGPKARRPYLASECHDLNEADKWRQQILREVGKKVMDIQNAGLGEHRIRDLNDEINKLIREKSHWERRIVELGGPDYARTAPKVTDSDGRALAEATGRGPGYRYFGAAKTLPGVRELFDREAPRQVRRTRAEMHRHIDGDYYGFRDEEDGALEPLEAAAEVEMRAAALAEWREKEAERAAALGAAAASAMPSADEADAPRFVAYVPLPDQKEIEQRVLESKKKAILDRYASTQEQAAQEDARALLNR